MKALPLALLLCCAGAAAADELRVTAELAALPAGHYARMPEPGCSETMAHGESLTCAGGWSRYALTRVATRDGRALLDTVVLIYTDPRLAGRHALVLEPLGAQDAERYGARFKARIEDVPDVAFGPEAQSPAPPAHR